MKIVKIMNIHRKLKNYCRWNKPDKVEKILENNDNIDLTYDDGTYFGFAFVYGNSKLLQTLLSYYEKHELQYSPNLVEYKIAKSKLKNILEEKIECHHVSNEFLAILQPYLVIDPSYNLTQNEGYSSESEFEIGEEIQSGYFEEPTTNLMA